MMTSAERDAEALRRSAKVIRQRSTKPKAIFTVVLCRLLLDTAAKIEAQAEGGA